MRKAFEFLKSNLWLIPTLIVLLSVVAAFGLIEVDRRVDHKDLLEDWIWLLEGGASGAREMLSTIAGSAITVAGVVFSITIVVLSLASSQYSPRVLRNFMGDWKSQAVLGGFLGIFAYCLVVLRAVRGEDHDAFVPSIAVLVSLVLALTGIALLIFFIHHIASSIRATSIVRAVYQETIEAIDAIYPNKLFGDEINSSATELHTEQFSWFEIKSPATGYLQRAELNALKKIAREKKLTIKVEASIGSFIIEGGPIASTSAEVDQKTRRKIVRRFKIGRDRTLEQDVGFGIRQLVDVGLKGLSPGINDTTSAAFCIDHLGAIVTRLADRSIASTILKDGFAIRVIDQGPTFEHFVSAAFDQLRQYGKDNPAILLRIATALNSIRIQTAEPTRLAAIDQQLAIIEKIVESKIPLHDRNQIDLCLLQNRNDGIFLN